uniref:Uncharacterized protein n=1 Tax=Oryza punctata TaxID=4537 RepID=A0A0E0KQE8_ORYPU
MLSVLLSRCCVYQTPMLSPAPWRRNGLLVTCSRLTFAPRGPSPHPARAHLNLSRPSRASLTNTTTRPHPPLLPIPSLPPRPHLFFFYLALARFQPNHPRAWSVHGGRGSPPRQPRLAHGEAPAPVAAAAEAAAAPRLLSVSPASAVAALRRAGDQGGGGPDGRGDHREVRPRVRPLESVQLQGGGRGGRRGEDEEVEDRAGEGAPGQVRRRVPGNLHHALAHLLHALLPPHQRRRRRAGPPRQGWDRDGGDRREGGDVRAGLRGAQGGVADQVPADGGAYAGGGQLDWEDQEGGRLIDQVGACLPQCVNSF